MSLTEHQHHEHQHGHDGETAGHSHSHDGHTHSHEPETPVHEQDPGAEKSPRRLVRRVLLTLGAGLGIASLVVVGGLVRGSASTPTESAALANSTTIEGMQAYLTQVPQDWASWATLGQLELERGRTTGDPTWYAKAEASFTESSRLQPTDNSPALAGIAALAAARHDFSAAQTGAEAALAVNPLDLGALGTLTDALTELGRYPEALQVANRLDSTHPGISSYTRLAYQRELRGDVPGALSLMALAARDASTNSQVAFARYQEGMLALTVGRTVEAESAYAAGRAQAPDDSTLLHLGARIAVARNDLSAAAALYADLVNRRPLATYAEEYADVLMSQGNTTAANAMIALAKAQLSVARSQGVAVEPSEVLFEAKHGSATRAVELGREVWSRQQGIFAADALAVALHAAGQNREALVYADKAVSLGTRTPSLREHRAAIVAALGEAS